LKETLPVVLAAFLFHSSPPQEFPMETYSVFFPPLPPLLICMQEIETSIGLLRRSFGYKTIHKL
jgi:hypothetical protein